MRNIIQIALLNSLLATSVIASDIMLPVGNLVSANNVSITTDTGSTRISGDYAYMSGDVIRTKEGAVAALSLDGGNIYISPDSKAKVDVVDEKYLVTVDLGSIGFNFESGVEFSIISPDQIISANNVANASSGTVTVNKDGETVVVQALTSTLKVVSLEGVQQMVRAGQQWGKFGDAQIALTQVIVGTAAWWQSPLVVLGVSAGVSAVILNQAKGTKNIVSPSN